MSYLKNFFKTHKLLKILFLVILSIFIILRLSSLIVQHQVEAGKWVEVNGKWYFNEKEIQQLFAGQYIDTPAKNTPEEVYADFRTALLADEIDVALTHIREENQGGYREAFENSKKLNDWIPTLPESLVNVRVDGNFGYYDWEKGDGYKHTIDFLKNVDGYWLIDNI